MVLIKSLSEFKHFSSVNLRKNIDNDTSRPMLKAQMIESNLSHGLSIIPGFHEWYKLEDSGYWYACYDDHENVIVSNKLSDRIFSVYSLMKVESFDYIMNKWIRDTLGLDKCWLPIEYLRCIANSNSWKERGIGIKCSGLYSVDENPSRISVKAWYGDNEVIKDSFDKLADQFSVNSLKFKDNRCSMISEWYTQGKVTFNSSEDVDAAIESVNQMVTKYERALKEAEKIVRSEKCSFEFNFKQKLDLESYSKAVSVGKGDLKLWMTETESYPYFRRFRGVDMHTWDRVFLDMGQDFAYLTIPGEGCVNAAPRMVTVHGEAASGKTKVYLDGVEVFV